MSAMNAALAHLFRDHGVESDAPGDHVVFPGRPLRATAAIVNEMVHPSAVTVQLDVWLRLQSGRELCESFAGVGPTRDEAARDAFRLFASNTFHVLLSAFFDRPNEQSSREDVTLRGRPCRITLGTLGMRGQMPRPGPEMAALYHRFEEALREQPFTGGTHWVRLYYAHLDGRTHSCEVLLDNQPWPAMQERTAALDWPASEPFYSLRVFQVIEVGPAEPTTPEGAVERLADILAAQEEFSEQAADAAMAAAGVPRQLADRAYHFTQIAWARLVMEGIGGPHSPRYLYFDANGEVVESGLLADEPCFAHATRLIASHGKRRGFKALSLRSADVNAANQALHAGTKAEDIVLGPAGVFVAPPTPAGLEAARRHLKPEPRP
jgi:hypothetical protein